MLIPGIRTVAHLSVEHVLLYSHKLKWHGCATWRTQHADLLAEYCLQCRRVCRAPHHQEHFPALCTQCLLNLLPSLPVPWPNSRSGLGNVLIAERPAGKSAHRGPKICRFIASKPKSILKKKEEIKIDEELEDRKGSQWRLDALLVDSSSLFYCSTAPITAVLFQLMCSEQTFVLHRSFFT